MICGEEKGRKKVKGSRRTEVTKAKEQDKGSEGSAALAVKKKRKKFISWEEKETNVFIRAGKGSEIVQGKGR
jgi:hypothetical protein